MEEDEATQLMFETLFDLKVKVSEIHAVVVGEDEEDDLSCEVMNGNRPGDNSLPSHRRDVLERYVDPTMAALRACGASPDTADQKPEPKGQKKMTVHPETVADLLEAGLLKRDTVLQPLREGVTGSARVVADGRLEVDGHMHASLSGAAKAVTGAPAESGWDFWGAPSGDGGFVALSKLRARLRDAGRAVVAAAAGPPDTPIQPAISGRIDLVALVSSAGLNLPLALHAKYRGQTVRASLEPDGSIIFAGETFRSPSTAGTAARMKLGYQGGRTKPATNGWTWWWFTDSEGIERPLDFLRTTAPVLKSDQSEA